MKTPSQYLESYLDLMRSEADPSLKESLLTEWRSSYPKDSNAHFYLGHFLNEVHRFSEAIEIFTVGLAIDPNDIGALHALALAYWGLKEYDETLRCLELIQSKLDTPSEELTKQIEAVTRLKFSSEPHD